MARKAKAPKKSGGRKFKVPTQNEILKKYGSSLQFKASTINHHGLWIPSTFFALNYQMGGGSQTRWLDANGKVTDDITKDRKSTRLNSSHSAKSRMPSSA